MDNRGKEMTYVTSDSHFNHNNIIKYCNRPFASAEEMNESLINNWNSKVTNQDQVYHLGDFALGRSGEYSAENILRRLNGKIHLIEGNHNSEEKRIKHLFASYNKFLEVSINGQLITLCHYALRVWNKSHRGAWSLHGHSHGSLPDDPNSLSFDVGVDCHNFYPLSFDEVKTIMAKKTWKPIDHHGEKK